MATALKLRPEKYILTLTALSPLHIGTGNTLRKDFDYVVHKGRTWVANQEAFAELLYDEGHFKELARGIPIGQLVEDDDYDENNGLWRYVLKGEPAAESRGAEVAEQIKDIWDRPYIPGSSLKGAIRTALFVRLFAHRKMSWDAQSLDNRAKHAADNLEKKIFGRDPNHDALRALQVSDSLPGDARQLVLLNLIATKSSDGSGDNPPITLEAVAPGATFQMSMTIDSHLLSEPVRQQLEISDSFRNRLSEKLPKSINKWTEGRLAVEIRRPRSGQWRTQFEDMVRTLEGLGDNEALLQLGWGGGWDSKTLGVCLTSEEEEFTRLVNKYRKEMLFRGRAVHRTGDLYPKTRRVRLTGKNLPIKGELGWVKLTFERVKANL
jgi:CRISPR-associated protein Csm5